jgi:hypothetical protein
VEDEDDEEGTYDGVDAAARAVVVVVDARESERAEAEVVGGE